MDSLFGGSFEREICVYCAIHMSIAWKNRLILRGKDW